MRRACASCAVQVRWEPTKGFHVPELYVKECATLEDLLQARRGGGAAGGQQRGSWLLVWQWRGCRSAAATLWRPFLSCCIAPYCSQGRPSRVASCAWSEWPFERQPPCLLHCRPSRAACATGAWARTSSTWRAAAGGRGWHGDSEPWELRQSSTVATLPGPRGSMSAPMPLCGMVWPQQEGWWVMRQHGALALPAPSPAFQALAHPPGPALCAAAGPQTDCSHSVMKSLPPLCAPLLHLNWWLQPQHHDDLLRLHAPAPRRPRVRRHPLRQGERVPGEGSSPVLQLSAHMVSACLGRGTGGGRCRGGPEDWLAGGQEKLAGRGAGDGWLCGESAFSWGKKRAPLTFWGPENKEGAAGVCSTPSHPAPAAWPLPP